MSTLTLNTLAEVMETARELPAPKWSAMVVTPDCFERLRADCEKEERDATDAPVKIPAYEGPTIAGIEVFKKMQRRSCWQFFDRDWLKLYLNGFVDEEHLELVAAVSDGSTVTAKE